MPLHMSPFQVPKLCSRFVLYVSKQQASTVTYVRKPCLTNVNPAIPSSNNKNTTNNLFLSQYSAQPYPRFRLTIIIHIFVTVLRTVRNNPVCSPLELLQTLQRRYRRISLPLIGYRVRHRPQKHALFFRHRIPEHLSHIPTTRQRPHIPCFPSPKARAQIVRSQCSPCSRSNPTRVNLVHRLLSKASNLQTEKTFCRVSPSNPLFLVPTLVPTRINPVSFQLPTLITACRAIPLLPFLLPVHTHQPRLLASTAFPRDVYDSMNHHALPNKLNCNQSCGNSAMVN
mmetsp:Transcript_6908/g.12235  ORF Transcript_6908/g.12235 Transcript_6908/m.12235 type:complete len:284 (-) Transcript_6908:163-1014(-)